MIFNWNKNLFKIHSKPKTHQINEVISPKRFSIHFKMNQNEAKTLAIEYLNKVELKKHLFNKYPSELSGGERQRAALARAIIMSPDVILADEPTANLDMTIGREIITLVKHLNTENNVTIISATHDLKMLDVSDRIVDIRDGKVERIRNRDEIQLEVGAVGH